MKILSIPYIKIKYNKEGECRESLINTGDTMWVKIDKMFVLGDLYFICPNEVDKATVIVRAKNNMYEFSTNEIATFFEKANDHTVADVEASCEFKSFIIDDFNNEPIYENEECLLLEPATGYKVDYTVYKATVESIKNNLVILSIYYYIGNKISTKANLAIDPNNSSRFLIKKTKGEYK